MQILKYVFKMNICSAELTAEVWFWAFFSQIVLSSPLLHCQYGMGLERFVSQLQPVAFGKGTGTCFSVNLSRWDGENLLLVLS